MNNLWKIEYKNGITYFNFQLLINKNPVSFIFNQK